LLNVVQLPRGIIEFTPRRCGVSPPQRAVASVKLLPDRVKIVPDASQAHAHYRAGKPLRRTRMKPAAMAT
jgi:hypothetical protein